MRSAPSPPRARPSRGRALALLQILVIVAAGVLVWHRALGYFFCQDDFVSLGRAAGLWPRMHGPWRWLGNQAVFDLMRPIAGLSAAPYHLVSLLCHLGSAVLLFLLLRRRFADPAPFVASAYFVTQPMLFTAVYWVSVLADPLSLALAIAALLALDARGPWHWSAVPLFVASLLAKESTILLPLVAALMPPARAPQPATEGGEPARPRPWRDPVLIALAAVAIAYAVYFRLSAYRTYFLAPTPAQAATGAAYSAGFGPHLLWNLLTYLGWSANSWAPAVSGFSDVADTNVSPWAVAELAIWLVGLAIPSLRRGGWLAGGAVFLLMLAPVLPLAHHTYHYYLYAPMLGAGIAAAALVQWTIVRLPYRAALARSAAARRGRPPGRDAANHAPAGGPMSAVWLAAAAVAALLTWNGYALVREIETHPFLRPELRSDPTVDRSRIAANARDGIAAAALPAGTRLAFWTPAVLESPSPGETYWEKNVRSALVDGFAVRLMFPGIPEAVFVHDFRPLPPPWRYAVYVPDGRLRVMAPAELDSLLRAHPR